MRTEVSVEQVRGCTFWGFFLHTEIQAGSYSFMVVWQLKHPSVMLCEVKMKVCRVSWGRGGAERQKVGRAVAEEGSRLWVRWQQCEECTGCWCCTQGCSSSTQGLGLLTKCQINNCSINKFPCPKQHVSSVHTHPLCTDVLWGGTSAAGRAVVTSPVLVGLSKPLMLC